MLIVLILYCLTLFGMLLWAVMQIFKDSYEFPYNRIWFPKLKDFTLVNFSGMIEYADMEWLVTMKGSRSVPITEIIFNSIVYSVGGAFIHVLVTCIVAYLASKYKYWYSRILYGTVIIVMIIPVVGSQASEIEILTKLGLYNTRYSFVVLKAGFVGIYFLVFYEMFRSIPNAYSEAAMIDGANDWYVMVRIYMPLIRNVFMTVFLITFITFWNDYQMPLLYMPDYPTLSYFLFKLQTSSKAIELADGRFVDLSYPTVKMAATVVLMTPILIIFITLHDKLMGNLTIGGVKG